eukprot:5404208-Ditylum_brightwellii.AAC.1
MGPNVTRSTCKATDLCGPTLEPSCSLTELLVNLCKETQGGIDRATGHQFTPSTGTVVSRPHCPVLTSRPHLLAYT